MQLYPLSSMFSITTCTVLYLSSTLPVDGLRPCQPSDHLHLHVPVDIENVNKKKEKESSYGFDHTQCLYDCKYEHRD